MSFLDVLGGAVTNAASSTTVEVETSLAPLVPPIKLGLGTGGEPSWLMKMLRPRVVVRSGGTVLYQAQPAGDPRAGVPWGLIAAGGLAVVAVVVLVRVLK